jgi:methylglutaconyl-CoA hydratase
MDFEYVIVNTEEQIATITLNRPDKRNAMNEKMVREITQALTMLSTDTSVHTLIINGHGEHFCAGADIAHMKAMSDASYKDNYDDAQLLADLMYQLYTFPKPTIVLAHGITLGGGLGLLATCDIAIVADDASFGFSEVKIGITPSTISPYVVAAIGQRAASFYFLTGTRFDAAEAKHIGLAHQVTEANALFRTGHALAKTLSMNSPKAMHSAKELIHHVANHAITAELGQKTAEHLANIRTSAQAKEGLQAFLEKRTPVWNG